MFFRKERDWLLKEAPPKIGQKGYVGSAGGSPDSFVPTRADDFYYFESPDIPATATLARHLAEVDHLVSEAEALLV